MTDRTWVRLDPQDGTNCRSCAMTARTCQDHEPGEVAAVCCDSCNHPGATGNECVTECLCEDDDNDDWREDLWADADYQRDASK